VAGQPETALLIFRPSFPVVVQLAPEYATRVLARYLKFGAALAVLLVLTNSPALNCMSSLYKMNIDEMACCQHHAGDCDMGQLHMSCCQTVSPHSPANAILAAQTVHLDVALHVLPVVVESFTVVSRTVAIENDDSSPPAPPGNITILRT
jgi:hypothetical protein